MAGRQSCLVCMLCKLTIRLVSAESQSFTLSLNSLYIIYSTQKVFARPEKLIFLPGASQRRFRPSHYKKGMRKCSRFSDDVCHSTMANALISLILLILIVLSSCWPSVLFPFLEQRHMNIMSAGSWIYVRVQPTTLQHPPPPD